VYFLPFAMQRFRSRVNLNMTMWETDRIPDQWIGITDKLTDGLIVPCEFCADAFRARTDVPVRAVPFGTDTDLYTYHDRAERLGQRDSCYTFLMAGALHHRKGLEFALRAFREEFRPDEPVRLWLKTRLHFLDPGDEHAMLADPRITVIRADYTREGMRSLYHYADAFLAPSRGEGSGLTPRDAMATGLPVILTDWSGLTEIAREGYSYPVPVAELEPAPVESSSISFGVSGGGDIGNFARPNIRAMRARMRQVYEDRDESLSRGKRAAQWMREEWTWDRCAGRWLDAVRDLSGENV
jgi:glycosyltransferase involved in cell wall biosynthesis